MNEYFNTDNLDIINMMKIIICLHIYVATRFHLCTVMYCEIKITNFFFIILIIYVFIDKKFKNHNVEVSEKKMNGSVTLSRSTPKVNWFYCGPKLILQPSFT